MADGSPQVVVIAGPNGAGKTTLAPFLLRDTFGLTVYVNADSIAHGLSAFSPEAAAIESGRIMLKRLRDLASRKETFAFETTLSTLSYATWLGRLKREGYNFHLIFLWLQSPELALRRVGERVSAGGHDVPEHIIRRRYAKGVGNFLRLYVPLADTWVVYDNSTSGTVPRVAQGRGLKTEKVLDAALWRRIKEAAK
ncbi:MAG: zeta toxin family protein [Pyrinomonadaceae bacterium]